MTLTLVALNASGELDGLVVSWWGVIKVGNGRSREAIQNQQLALKEADNSSLSTCPHRTRPYARTHARLPRNTYLAAVSITLLPASTMLFSNQSLMSCSRVLLDLPVPLFPCTLSSRIVYFLCNCAFCDCCFCYPQYFGLSCKSSPLTHVFVCCFVIHGTLWTLL